MTPAQFKDAMESLGITRPQAAALLGYGSATRISEIVNGKLNPSVAVTRLLQAYVAGYRPDDWPAP